MEDFDDDSDLAEFDKHCSENPVQPWGGGIRPSSQRFFRRYKDFFEAQKLAQWLAFESNHSVDLLLIDDEWSFSCEAHDAVRKLDQIEGENSQFIAEGELRAQDHWLINENYYNERLTEDRSWGRDESGEPFGMRGC